MEITRSDSGLGRFLSVIHDLQGMPQVDWVKGNEQRIQPVSEKPPASIVSATNKALTCTTSFPSSFLS